MSFHAKPNGGYGSSQEAWQDNMLEIYGILNAAGWTLEAVSAFCGGCIRESQMNPWRWQDDVVNLSAGYGLVQFTPASDYIDLNLQYHSPNMSTREITQGASPNDGICQVNVVNDDTLGKWLGVTWRDYWRSGTYPRAWQFSVRLRATYQIPMPYSTFKQMTVLDDAIWMFMSGYLGPLRGDRDFELYLNAGRTAYRFLSGHEPPTPTPATSKLPLIFYLKRHPF